MSENTFVYNWLVEVSKEWKCIPGGSLSVYGVEVCKSHILENIPKGLVFDINRKLPLLYEDILVVSNLGYLSVGAYFGHGEFSHDRYPFFKAGVDNILDVFAWH